MKSFKNKTTDEKLTTIYRQQNLIMKTLGIKSIGEKKTVEVEFNAEKFRSGLYKKQSNS
jgi:hypothetical protein